MYIRPILILFFVAFAALAAAAQKQAASAAKPDPAKGVREAFERLVEGIRQVDVNKVMGVYEKSDRILFFNNNGTVTNGWENMRSNRAASYPRTKDVTLDITGLRVEMLGNSAAYVTCKWKQSQVFDEKLETASGRMTLVFRKIGTEWKVVHLHTSPDNPAPARPVLDSERPAERGTQTKAGPQEPAFPTGFGNAYCRYSPGYPSPRRATSPSASEVTSS
jgi:ketosteroid isomerase-like protein